MSAGVAAMIDFAAAVPFPEAAGLLEDLAGIRLTVKRVERGTAHQLRRVCFSSSHGAQSRRQ
jgi:hypothetical protein